MPQDQLLGEAISALNLEGPDEYELIESTSPDANDKPEGRRADSRAIPLPQERTDGKRQEVAAQPSGTSSSGPHQHSTFEDGGPAPHQQRFSLQMGPGHGSPSHIDYPDIFPGAGGYGPPHQAPPHDHPAHSPDRHRTGVAPIARAIMGTMALAPTTTMVQTVMPLQDQPATATATAMAMAMATAPQDEGHTALAATIAMALAITAAQGQGHTAPVAPLDASTAMGMAPNATTAHLGIVIVITMDPAAMDPHTAHTDPTAPSTSVTLGPHMVSAHSEVVGAPDLHLLTATALSGAMAQAMPISAGATGSRALGGTGLVGSTPFPGTCRRQCLGVMQQASRP
ncbi:hypothetical protein WJX84_007262 [Apatococcus fuscideae]|uniref:Uncharacterized protein n=1 Tax=Apatococcus fuscideae TaxID=2026836 RepID=A0AAW1STG6_9CHLO